MSPYRYNFDRVASVYEMTRALPANAQNDVSRALAQVVRGRSVLEVGVGTGRWARPLQEQGIPVVGVDVSRAMLAQGRPRGLKNVLLAEAHRLPFRKGSFDFSMSNHVLHLLDNWTGALQEMCRVSRDSFVSVVDRPGAIPDLDHEYYDAVTASGIDTSRPGLPERELATRVPPDETIPLGRFHDTASAESWVKLLGLKSSTSQWVVPSDVHEQIMRELERNHRDETVRWWVDIELVRWNADRLSAALERW